jgi:DNA-binding response OmpR family regulator
MPPKPRLLIFDEQPVFASLLARGLSQHGYNVKVFYTPNEALAHDQTSYDHAILGIQGQATNGVDLGLQLWQ